VFGLFASPLISDPDFGELKRSRGMWRGRISFSGQTVSPLILAGPKSAPDPIALKLAKSIAGQYPSWQAVIEKELIEHLAPYAEAVVSEALPAPDETLPVITKPSDVWPHVAIESVAVAPLDGKLTIEFGYRVTWDEEHTLGARFQDGRFVELCGSVLCP